MPKELQLFLKDELTFKEKFYKFMDILISNQPDSRLETLLLMIINYMQILSSFYAEQIQIFNPKSSKSDLILNNLEKLLRIKDLLRNNYIHLSNLMYFILALLIFCISHFLITCIRINNNSIYSFNKIVNNYIIKIFIYLGYNIILDMSFSNFCFGFTEYNPNFEGEIKCNASSKIHIIIISIIVIIITFSVRFILQIFYYNTFFISNSFYSKMISNYDIFMDLNCFFNSILLVQVYFLQKEFFLLYNLIFSLFICVYYIKHYLYYDPYVNLIAGIFHFLYVWTSIFGILCAYIDFNGKAIIYLITCLIVIIFYFNVKNKIENDIFYNVPLTKFDNLNYLLYFLKYLTDKIIKYEESNENKAFISGVLQILIDENPNSRCDALINSEIYLPSENKWRDEKKRKEDDIVYIKYFVVLLFNYLLYNEYSCPELYFNLSMYYLKVIKNYCEAMYYCQKISDLRLNLKQKFSFKRLKLKISEALLENLKPYNEQNVSLENINISMYYKYDSLTHNFIEEISNDIDLSLEFWKIFKKSLKEPKFKINFNKIFKLTQKIQMTKNNIEKIWVDLLKIYSGINEYFELYNDYIEQINNDDLKKRDLDSFKKKSVNFNEHLNHNYYSILFNNETGIMIVNGDKGSEGIIKQCNKKIELMFDYNNSELKDVNVNKLMPKLYDKIHSKYIERYFRIGYKKYMDTKDFKTFGKDKNNSIIQIRIALKLFPILNYNVFFVSLILKDNINDIILIDENFNIQGMSSKLMKALNINNIFLFQKNNIPFYAICKKFINFYSIFIGNKKKEASHELKQKKLNLSDRDTKYIKKLEEQETITKIEDEERDEVHETLEINENVELEFEIKLPQFLINYSNKKSYKIRSMHATLSVISENQEFNKSEFLSNLDINSEEEKETYSDNENELFITDSKTNKLPESLSHKNNNSNTPIITPGGESPTPTPTPSSPKRNLIKNNKSFKSQINKINKISEEEKIFLEKIKDYETLFKEEKFEELEDLIDLCNKDSVFSEYKFNFTFDKYKFGDNGLAYIIRCIDNRNQEGLSEEKSLELDSNAVKYKKEKEGAIKPLFELLEEERQSIINMPGMFLKLSMENKKFQALLDTCKNEIMSISKTQGQKKDEVLEDENSSQTSHLVFDNGLVKKNRIEEIRSNLFNNVSNFFTLKYIKLILFLITLLTIIFSVAYLLFIISLSIKLRDVCTLNLNFFQASLWTTEITSIFISLKTLFLKKMGKIHYDFLNFKSETIITNEDYYKHMESLANRLYYNLTYYYGTIEMYIPHYISESQLLSTFWDHINVSYINTDYIRNNRIADESCPVSLLQFLRNCINFLKIYNISKGIKFNDEAEEYFNYTSYLIIENSYTNILPNLFIKLQKLPKMFSEYNTGKRITILSLIIIYIGLIIILSVLYLLMIYFTNISIVDIIKTIAKIKLEKIEETIKRIEIFSNNLKKFRDRDLINMEDNNQNETIHNKFSVKSNNNYNTSLDQSIVNKTLDNTIMDESSLNNNGFNIDIKKYNSLTILTEYIYLYLIFLFTLLGFISPIYIYSINTIKNINQFLLIESYIYGKLISNSANILEVKCFISECNTSTVLDYSELKSNDNIQEIIKGIRHFQEIEDFYNNKFLLNACKAAINEEVQKRRYDLCINDSVIISANNTDNIMKLIENIIDNIYKKDEMDQGRIKTLANGTNITYFRQLLFNETIFQNIENIFYKYVFSVDEILEDVIEKSLNDYLKIRKNLLVILIFCLACIIIIYIIFFLIVSVPKLVYLLSVSRCVLKIIPTSIIMNTPELETWIENKY